MDWVKIGQKVGNGLVSATKAILEESLRRQAEVQGKVNKGYAKAQKLSDEELKRKVMKSYKEEGKRDIETLTMAKEYMDRKKK